MTKKQEFALVVIDRLKEIYPIAECSLDYNKAYELLIAVRLSAQCTDARVNIVCEDLFKKYPTLMDFYNADVLDIEKIIKPCGLGKTKSRDISLMTKSLVDNYNSTVPDSIDELIKLPGIGRKSANLIMGDVYKKPAVVVDTHCIRISNRLKLVNSKNPLIIENQLRKILPPEESSDLCHRFVFFGREFCKAPKPNCSDCPISDICPSKIQ